MLRFPFAALSLLLAAAPIAAAERHNVILFVPDGLRSEMVTPDNAPNMAALAHDGVYFANSHSLYPTVTTANASGFSTGHSLGDTGDFGNAIYVGFPVPAAHGSVIPFIENDQVIGELDKHFGSNFLNEDSILELADKAGYATAAIGKEGPTLLFSHRMRDGNGPIVIDDRTGRAEGVPLPSWLATEMTMHDISVATPSRGANADRGTKSPNIQQLTYFTKVIDTLVLPKFKQDGKPFFLVYWSRDPDGTQHNEGDSPDSLTPGINGRTSLAAIRNADAQIGKLRETLAQLGLDRTTDIIVAADHGFSTISKESRTSVAAQSDFDDVPRFELPPGFVALDLAAALDLPLFDPGDNDAPVAIPGHHPKGGSGLLGNDPAHPDLIVASDSGSDLLYLPSKDKSLAGRIVQALLRQDYTSGIFVDPALGDIPGTLPLTAIGLAGKARTPMPSIVVNFRSMGTGCPNPNICAAGISDTTLEQGMGNHGSFSRADSFNFAAAIGPDFKTGYRDPAPINNADIAQTIAALLHLAPSKRGPLSGRSIAEALIGGKEPVFTRETLRSKPSPDGQVTILQRQKLGDFTYIDAAGFPGKTVGLDD